MWISIKFGMRFLSSSRDARYGEMAAAIAMTPLRESNSQTKPMRLMFSSRSSFEKPSPWQSRVLVISPSRTSTFAPSARRREPTSCEIVLLPLPDRPVNHRVQPVSIRLLLRNNFSTSPMQRNDLPLCQNLTDPRDALFQTAEQRCIHVDKTLRVNERYSPISFYLVKEIRCTNRQQACCSDVLHNFKHDAAVTLRGDDMRKIATVEKFTFDLESELKAAIQPDENRRVPHPLLPLRSGDVLRLGRLRLLHRRIRHLGIATGDHAGG